MSIYLGIGQHKKDIRFDLHKLEVDEVEQLFINPEVGDKDGMCFNPALPKVLGNNGYSRTNDNIKAMTCIVYDIDYMHNAAKLIKVLRKKWKFYWIAHSSHSHKSTSTDLSRNIIKGELVSEVKANIKEYFLKKRNFKIKGLKDIKLGSKRVTFSHKPVDKIRIIIPLLQPCPVKDNKDNRWIDLYYNPAKQAGFEDMLDDTGVMISRYFFTPRVAKGKEDEFISAVSKHEPLFSAPTLISDSDELIELREKGFNLKAWLKNQAAFDIESFMSENTPQDVIKDRPGGGLYVSCPHKEHHTHTGDSDTYVVNTEEGFVFHCSHDSCAEVGRNGRVAKVLLDYGIDKKTFKQYSIKGDDNDLNSLLHNVKADMSEARLSDSASNSPARFERLITVGESAKGHKGVEHLIKMMRPEAENLELGDLSSILSPSEYGKTDLVYIMSQIGIQSGKRSAALRAIFNVRTDEESNENRIMSVLEKIDSGDISTIEKQEQLSKLSEFFGKTMTEIRALTAKIRSNKNDELTQANYFSKMDKAYGVYYDDPSVKINLKKAIPIPTINEFFSDYETYLAAAVTPSFIPNASVKFDMSGSFTVIGQHNTGVDIKRDNFRDWMETDTNKYVIDSISFNPNTTDRVFINEGGYHTYNLWEGYKSPIRDTVFTYNSYEDLFEDKDIATFLNHLKAHCNDNERILKWLILWFASLIQRPGVRYPTAVIIKGGQGTGKSLITDEFMSKFLYPYYLSVTDVDKVINGRGTMVEGKILIMLDDATFAGSGAQQKKIKSFISSKTLNVDAKYVKEYTVPMYARLILTTNDHHVAIVEVGDRRNLILQAAAKWELSHAKNEEYFGKLIALSESPKFMGKLRYLFSSIQPEMLGLEWNDLQTAPMTEAKAHQLQNSFTPMQKFLIELVTNGMIRLRSGHALKWKMDKIAKFTWPQLIDLSKRFHLEIDRHLYEKETLEEAMIKFGLHELLPNYDDDGNNIPPNITRSEALITMYKYGILSDKALHAAVKQKDAFLRHDPNATQLESPNYNTNGS